MSYDEKTPLTNMKIRVRFGDIVKERKKDTVMHSMHKAMQERIRKAGNKSGSQPASTQLTPCASSNQETAFK